MTSRDRILRRLRATRPPLPAMTPLPSLSIPALTPDQCVARFSAEAAALGVDCFVASSVADVQRHLAGMVNGKRLLCWDDDQLPYGAGQIVGAALRGDASPDQQASADIGVTGCDAAIAETASLMLFSGPGRARTVSLLPPTHVAVVPRQRLCATMAEAFVAHAKQLADSAACTITG
jgi:L-lactate dehydrogenase complex protein LldG